MEKTRGMTWKYKNKDHWENRASRLGNRPQPETNTSGLHDSKKENARITVRYEETSPLSGLFISWWGADKSTGVWGGGQQSIQKKAPLLTYALWSRWVEPHPCLHGDPPATCWWGCCKGCLTWQSLRPPPRPRQRNGWPPSRSHSGRAQSPILSWADTWR